MRQRLKFFAGWALPTLPLLFGLLSPCLAATIHHRDSTNRFTDLPVERIFPGAPTGIYHFEETLANTTIDGSGLGNHGDITGTGTTRIAGAKGNAFSFNPSSTGKITLSNVAVTNQITIAAWIKLGTTTANARHAVSRHPGWYLSNNIVFGTCRFAIKTSGDVSVDFDTLSNIGTSEWHHYTGVYDGSGIYTYLDGQLKNSGIQSGNIDTSGSTRIGGYWNNNSTSAHTWNGSLDEVLIFARALTGDEIQRLYLRGR